MDRMDTLAAVFMTVFVVVQATMMLGVIVRDRDVREVTGVVEHVDVEWTLTRRVVVYLESGIVLTSTLDRIPVIGEEYRFYVNSRDRILSFHEVG